MKPSFGRIPHPFPAASQTSVYGVEVTTVRDAARHLDVTAGPADIDRTTLPPPTVNYENAIETLDVSGLRVAYSPNLGYGTVDEELAEIAEAAARDLFAALGQPFTVDRHRHARSRAHVAQFGRGRAVAQPRRRHVARPCGRPDGLRAPRLREHRGHDRAAIARRFRYRHALEAAWATVLRTGRRDPVSDHRRACVRRRRPAAVGDRRQGSRPRAHDTVLHAGQPVLEPGDLGAGRY